MMKQLLVKITLLLSLFLLVYAQLLPANLPASQQSQQAVVAINVKTNQVLATKIISSDDNLEQAIKDLTQEAIS